MAITHPLLRRHRRAASHGVRLQAHVSVPGKHALNPSELCTVLRSSSALDSLQDCCIHEVREAQSRLRDLPQDATLQDPSVRRAGAAEALLSNSQDYSTRGTVHGIVKYIQESRGSPAAIGLAEEWLAVQQNKPEAMGLQAVADMALLVTKAHCDAAELALRGKNVVDSFASLQAAQSVASGHTVSQDLRDQVQAAIAEITPEYLRQQLSAPLPASTRADVLCLLHACLWQPDGSLSQSSPRRLITLRQLRPHLSVDELLWLYQSAPVDISEHETYELALAHMAHGVATGDPGVMVHAQRRLDLLDRVEDVSTERAVCSLLLGNPDQALVLLRLKRGCMPLAPNPDVSEFFAAYGDSEGQQTSAVIDFGERWVSSVLLPMVPFGTPWTRAFDMDAWADLPAVRAHVQLQHLPPFLLTTLRFVQRVAAALAHVLSAVLSTAGMRGAASHATAVYHRLEDPSHAAPPPPTPLGLPNLSARTHPHKDVVASAALLVSVAAGVFACTFGIRAAAARIAVPLPPRREPTPNVRVASDAEVTVELAAQVPTIADKATPVPLGMPELTMPDVKNTVLAWVEAKTRAMGPGHDVEALDTVLQGPMLRDWQRKAMNCKRRNWHWSYEASNIVIEKARQVRPDRARVTVHMLEKAHVITNGSKDHGYERNVRVEYQLQRGPSGWKLVGSQNVTQPTVSEHSVSSR